MRLAIALAAAVSVLTACGSAQELVDSAAPAESAPTSEPAPSPEPEPEPTTEPDATPEAEPQPAAAVPRVGECRRVSTSDGVLQVSQRNRAKVRCATRHNAQTMHVFEAKGAMRKALRSGSPSQIRETVAPVCRRALRSWVDASKARLARTRLDVLVGTPPVSDIESGAKWIRCDVLLRGSGSKLMRLPRKTKDLLDDDGPSPYDSCVRGRIDTESTDPVPCSMKHDWRSVATVRLGSDGASYPGRRSVDSTLRSRCTGPARAYLGTSGGFRYGWTLPRAADWKAGQRFGVCYVQSTS